MKTLRTNLFGYLQQLSKSLMVPLVFLVAISSMMGLGYTLSSFSIPFGLTLTKMASYMLSFLPFLFVAAISYSLTQDKQGFSILSGLLGYIAFLAYLDLTPLNSNILWPALLLSMLNAYLYNRLKALRLPTYLSFITGKRIIPFLMVFTGLFLGFLYDKSFASSTWIHDFFANQISKNPLPLSFFYGASNKAVSIYGMQHLLNYFFWFEPSNQTIVNYLHGISGQTVFLTGHYLINLFALPAVAIQMILLSKKAHRKSIRAVLGVAILTSLFTGVTEPIEFSFMLISPLLYLIHIILSGSAFLITNLLGIHLGFGFNASLIELLFQIKNPGNQHTLLIIPLGIAYFILYTVIFRILILKLNIKTPGRSEKAPMQKPNIADSLLEALGGKENIESLDNCATRLRIIVSDPLLISGKAIKESGALSYIQSGKHIQIIVGPTVSHLKDQMAHLQKITYIVLSPTNTDLLPIIHFPDDVFSKKLLGDGFFSPITNPVVLAPISGIITMIFPTKHAINIRTKEGIDFLIHIGIDASSLQGKGFTLHVVLNQAITQGDPLVTLDLDTFESHQIPMVVAVVCIQINTVSLTLKKHPLYQIRLERESSHET